MIAVVNVGTSTKKIVNDFRQPINQSGIGRSVSDEAIRYDQDDLKAKRKVN